VRTILEETLALLVYEMEAQRILVEKKYSPNLPPIPVDREQMKQVFLNLMLNALQAMEKGGTLRLVTRRASAFPGERDHSAAEVSIEDTGPGIPEDLQRKIFEPFFSTKEEGIGLGLPIAQRIAEEHGGQVRVDSSPGQGTTFTVMLPFS
jgi:signal transduction histidine kinase